MTGLQSVPVYKLPLLLTAPRKFSWENAFIDFSMADHDAEAAAAAEAQEAATAAASAESASGDLLTIICIRTAALRRNHVISPAVLQWQMADVTFHL